MPTLTDAYAGRLNGARVTDAYLGPAWVAGPLRRNRVKNTRGADSGWTPTRWFGSGGVGVYTYVATDGPPGTGITTARRKTWTKAPTSNGNSGFDVKATLTERYPVTPGEVVTVSGFVRCGSAGTMGAIRVVANFFDRTLVAGGVAVGGNNTGPSIFGDPGVWVRMTHTITVPAGALGMGCVLDVNNGPIWQIGETLDGTGLMIEKAPAMGRYGDGLTPGWEADAGGATGW